MKIDSMAAAFCPAITSSVSAVGSFKALPSAAFVKVSKLVNLPDLVPGCDDPYVYPETRTAGPYLADDHDGETVPASYAMPIGDLEAKAKKTFNNLRTSAEAVDHVDICSNIGHPGVEAPHAHVAFVLCLARTNPAS